MTRVASLLYSDVHHGNWDERSRKCFISATLLLICRHKDNIKAHSLLGLLIACPQITQRVTDSTKAGRIQELWDWTHCLYAHVPAIRVLFLFFSPPRVPHAPDILLRWSLADDFLIPITWTSQHIFYFSQQLKHTIQLPKWASCGSPYRATNRSRASEKQLVRKVLLL